MSEEGEGGPDGEDDVEGKDQPEDVLVHQVERDSAHREMLLRPGKSK